jgi:release factor glutamine methyltransferase
MTQEQIWLLNEKYNGIESDAFYADMKRLESGVPLAYLIGWQPFCGAKIYLDSYPLIPRPETEYWTKLAIDEIVKMKNPTILDLCAGSGCIGIAVLKEVLESTVDFVEIDKIHHATIRKNITENNIAENRYAILGGSLFEKIPVSTGMTTQQYDAILTNPPYIDPKLSNRIGESVLKYEPKNALFGGDSGMELITEILAQIPRFLRPGGVLYIEHEPEQVEKIQKLLPGIEPQKDQFGVVRFSVYKKT